MDTFDTYPLVVVGRAITILEIEKRTMKQIFIKIKIRQFNFEVLRTILTYLNKITSKFL